MRLAAPRGRGSGLPLPACRARPGYGGRPRRAARCMLGAVVLAADGTSAAAGPEDAEGGRNAFPGGNASGRYG